MDETASGISSSSNNETTAAASATTTTMALPKEPMPLSVYLRIRPFLDNELAKGEDQHLLDILSTKRVCVKIYSTAKNNIRDVQASFNEYEVTRVFDQACTQEELYEEILNLPMTRMISGQSILFFNLGITNSGKTHTMFGTDQHPGLITQAFTQIFQMTGAYIDRRVPFKPKGLTSWSPCHTKAEDLDNEIAYRQYIFKDPKRQQVLRTIADENRGLGDFSVEDEYYSIWVSFFELYNENIFDLLVKPSKLNTRKPLKFSASSLEIQDLIQVPVFDLEEAVDVVNFGFQNRSTSKTLLNDASSRSHAIVCITMLVVNEFSEQPTVSHLYICDLAGNEPSGTGKQNETANINLSLMTLKECVRRMNDNQKFKVNNMKDPSKQKKPWKIPFRESVLTGIFRPFFEGDGRTILCVNINPCASVISQTNELLKFSSLANKIQIVADDRAPVKKAKPVIKKKRLSNKKVGNKKKRATGEEEDDESGTGPTAASADHTAASAAISLPYHSAAELLSMEPPTDPNTVLYWKCLSARAFDRLNKAAEFKKQIYIELHTERVQSFTAILNQRKQIEELLDEKKSLSSQVEVANQDFYRGRTELANMKVHYDELASSNKHLKASIEKLECELSKKSEDYNLIRTDKNLLTDQLAKLQEQNDLQRDQQAEDRAQLDVLHKRELQQMKIAHEEAVQRLNRDLALEQYRKQDAEKKLRRQIENQQEEQAQHQQTKELLAKNEEDFVEMKAKYDDLQIEFMAVRRANDDEKHELNKTIDDLKQKQSTLLLPPVASSASTSSARPKKASKKDGKSASSSAPTPPPPTTSTITSTTISMNELNESILLIDSSQPSTSEDRQVRSRKRDHTKDESNKGEEAEAKKHKRRSRSRSHSRHSTADSVAAGPDDASSSSRSRKLSRKESTGPKRSSSKHRTVDRTPSQVSTSSRQLSTDQGSKLVQQILKRSEAKPKKVIVVQKKPSPTMHVPFTLGPSISIPVLTAPPAPTSVAPTRQASHAVDNSDNESNNTSPPPPVYATIQHPHLSQDRTRSPSVESMAGTTGSTSTYATASASNDNVNTTPKATTSTFKRIQSFFTKSQSPALTTSAKAQRVVQMKTTVAFGTTTPTRRLATPAPQTPTNPAPVTPIGAARALATTHGHGPASAPSTVSTMSGPRVSVADRKCTPLKPPVKYNLRSRLKSKASKRVDEVAVEEQPVEAKAKTKKTSKRKD